MHWLVPAAQTPSLPVLHVAPPPGLPSSMAPSQLLSKPSQTSGPAATFCWQLTAPAVHWLVPAAQTPSLPVLHAGSAGTSVLSATLMMAPLPLHTLRTQSPWVCVAMAVPEATSATPHVPAMHVRVWHAESWPGQSVCTTHATQPAPAHPVPVAPPLQLASTRIAQPDKPRHKRLTVRIIKLCCMVP